MAVKDAHYLTNTEDELPKAKLENVVATVKSPAEGKRNGSGMVLSQTMEDVAKKYREIQVEEGCVSDENEEEEEDDDDELLNSEDESRFGDFEAPSEVNDQLLRQNSHSALCSSLMPSNCSKSDLQTDGEADRAAELDGSERGEWPSQTSVKRGRASDRASFCSSTSAWAGDSEYLRRLEADQEELSGSLLALTSHFAQVQLRLKQVKAAPVDEKERLLSELEALAFRGVPDLRMVEEEDEKNADGCSNSANNEANFESGSEPGGRAQTGGSRRRVGRRRQAELIEQLKAQLTDLEQLAYEQGELPGLPTAKRLHNQRVLMERLQERLALRGDGLGPDNPEAAGAISDLLGDLERVPAEERDFDALVERAVGAILNPVRLKEKVVEQLKTQIVDLERFISFLQRGGAGQPPSEDANAHHAAGCPIATRAAALPRVGNTLRLAPASTCPCTAQARRERERERVARSDGNGNLRAKLGVGEKATATTAPYEVNGRSRALDSHLETVISATAVSQTTGRPRIRKGDSNSDAVVDELTSANGSRSSRAPESKASTSQTYARATERNSATNDSTRRNGRTRDEHVEASAARNLMKRIAALVHIFVLTNLACMNRDQVSHSGANSAAAHVNTFKEHHYGQALARLQILVDRVCQLAAANRQNVVMPTTGNTSPAKLRTKAIARERDSRNHGNAEQTTLTNNAKLQLCGAEETQDSNTCSEVDTNVAYASDEEECYIAAHELALTAVVRKQLVPVVRDLLEHGLRNAKERARLSGVTSCFGSANKAPVSPTYKRSLIDEKGATAWQLFARYYETKGGRQWSSQPARNLSAAFAIDVVGGRSVSAKQTLLAAIDCVLALHSKFKRSDDAKLKALLCLALNEHRLVPWLRLVVHNQAIVEDYYESWSYVAITGFEDALRALSRLQTLDFHLPFDLAVRQLQNIKDAF